ncbi:MAG: thermonuclease family protein, partial [Cyanobium sp.]
RLTVRLACLDAPELAQQPYGERARAHLRRLVPQGAVLRVQPLDTDRYGRTVAEVIGPRNLGLAMVEDGWAFVHPRHGRACDLAAYSGAERQASRRRLGLWREAGGIERPWQFRRTHRR